MQMILHVECNFGAECGRIVMRSADAVVIVCLVDSVEDISNWHAVNFVGPLLALMARGSG